MSLEVLQDRTDVVGDLLQDVETVAAEDAGDGVPQTFAGDPVQEAADGVLGLLHAVGEIVDLGPHGRRLF
ncbi:hypothetical protein ASD37_20735 [Mycobacterium sp. Root135]|nr:hypothetical protein ASD37_20735 [Mycobacterium sp. Root135]